MILNENNGVLIVVDGIDGAGKTTQVNMLSDLLRSVGQTVLTSKEPTDGVWGAKIRATAVTGRLSLEEELEAFIKDREEHLEQKVIPALSDGQIVILDRYFYSTIAYQGIRSADVEELERKVRKTAMEPDAVFVIDLDPEIAALRITKRDGKPNEFEKLDDQIQIRKIFKKLDEVDDGITTIGGNRASSVVHKEIVNKLLDGALKAKKCFKQYGCDDPYYCSYRMTETCEWWNLRSSIKKHLD